MVEVITNSELDSELTTALRARGQRVTVPRLLVHRRVRRGDGHLTAEQLRGELALELPTLSTGTIYATLDLLDELGLVRRVSTPAGATVYDPRPDAHHHLICRRCGRVQDLDASVPTGPARRAASAAGFRVDHAELQLTGLCSDCAG